MGKTNAYLAKRDAMLLAGYQKQLDIAFQMGLDAATMAANKVLKMGKGRAAEFCEEYLKAIQEIAKLTIEDSKDDKELVYSRESIDRDIRSIVGEENFDPWEVRYSMMNRHRKRKEN